MRELKKTVNGDSETCTDGFNLAIDGAEVEFEGTNGFNLAIDEAKVEFEEESKAEIKSSAQDSMGTKTKATLQKTQVQVEESTKLEENGKLQALGDKNSNLVKQQVIVNLTHEHEVTLQTSVFNGVCG